MAREQLGIEFQRIPLPEAAGTRGSWQSNRTRLRKHVNSHDPRAFLTWDVIRETMFPPPYAAFAQTELAFLKRHGNGVWLSAARERWAGLPLPCVFYPVSSANAIHHAYHLCRFEVETGAKVREFGTILEFGGGYGSLCRIAHQAGFGGQYVIFDLPEQSALQRYYLSAVGMANQLTISTSKELRAVEETFLGLRLFIATWSLSESPMELRKQIAKAISGFDAFLIAYQSEFGGIDNGAFFREWQSWFPDVRWTVRTIEQLPASWYLFGMRQRDEIAGSCIAHWS